MVELSPQWSEGYHTLSRCQRSLGEIELAYRHILTAMELDTHNDIDRTKEIVFESKEINKIIENLNVLRSFRKEYIHDHLTHKHDNDVRKEEDESYLDTDMCTSAAATGHGTGAGADTGGRGNKEGDIEAQTCILNLYSRARVI